MSELPIVERILRPMPVCPFDSPDCKVKENEPCPVCGDVNEFGAVSNCMSNRDKKIRQEAASLITELVEVLEPFVDLRVSRFMTDGLKYDFRIDAGHIRRAAAALARARSKGE